jgi:hypothetical protein
MPRRKDCRQLSSDRSSNRTERYRQELYHQLRYLDVWECSYGRVTKAVYVTYTVYTVMFWFWRMSLQFSFHWETR